MKSEKSTSIEKKTNWVYIIIGSLVLAYAVIDKFFLPEIDNLGVALPLGLMFLMLSQADRMAQKLGRKGMIVLLIIGIVLFLLGLAVYFLYR